MAKSILDPNLAFDVDLFLATAGPSHSITSHKSGDTVFSQGDRADDVFYVRDGKIKITIVSQRGKEAVIAIVPAGEFFGELALNGQRIRPATAVAMEECKIVRLSRLLMLATLREEPAFSKFFIEHFCYGIGVLRRTLSTNFLIPARSGSLGFFCYWL